MIRCLVLALVLLAYPLTVDTAGIGEGASGPFPLYTSSPFAVITAGVGAGVCPEFDLVTQSPFHFLVAGTGEGQSGAFALYLGRFGEGSGISNGFVLDLQLPGSPSWVKVTNLGTASSLKVEWSPSPPPVLQYELFRSTGGGGFQHIASPTQLEYTDEGLMRDVTYTYAVAATSPIGTGSPSPTASRFPDYYPVLLVHGICSNSGAFTDCSSADFPNESCSNTQDPKLGDALFQAGLRRLYVVNYRLDVSLADASQDVRQRIGDILLETGDPKLNLVAHSQGGLICRYLVEQPGAGGLGGKIANLVMIGTPNHGTDWARYAFLQPVFRSPLLDKAFSPFLKCLGKSEAVRNLHPGSAFLNQLNYGEDQSLYDSTWLIPCGERRVEPRAVGLETQYWLFHGTAEICWLPLGATTAILDLCEPNDGVVETGPRDDGDLVALGNEYKRQDVRLDPGGTYQRAAHNDDFAGEGKCRLLPGPDAVAELEHPSIISATFLALTEGSLPGSEAGTMVSLSGAGVAESTTEGLGFQELPTIFGSVTPGGSAIDTIVVDPGGEVSFAQTAEVASLSFSLQTPSGSTITPADTIPGHITYIGDPASGYQILTVVDPEPGRWLSITALADGAGPEEYALETILESETALDLEVSPAHPGLTDTLTIRATLVSLGSPAGTTTVTGVVARPDSNMTPLVFFDDGVHGDSLAGDGMFGGILTAEGGPGVYGVRVSASGGVGGLERMRTVTISLESLPDISIRGQDVEITRLHRDSDSLLVRVTLENLGSGDVSEAVVVFSDTRGTPFATRTAAIPAGGALPVSAAWLPNRADKDTLRITLDPFRSILQERYDNDSATVVVTPATVSVGETENSGVMRAWLGPSYPNPSTGSVSIQFSLPREANVRLDLYDIQGRLVRSLERNVVQAGAHTRQWDGRNNEGTRVSSGIYFYQLLVDGNRMTRKLVLIR